MRKAYQINLNPTLKTDIQSHPIIYFCAGCSSVTSIFGADCALPDRQTCFSGESVSFIRKGTTGV
jgi:uncharacterized metal-binding protein